jgi:hypothetical protein
MTKLFMRNNYDNPDHVSVLDKPMSYQAICLRCAAMMGGKINDQAASWSLKECDCCNIKEQVTLPRNFIWRS